MIVCGVRTSDVCVHPFDTMGKAVLNQKIQRSVRNGRLRAQTIFGENVEDFIRAERPVFSQQDFKNPAS